MKIPNVNKYESVEKLSSIDFLSDKLEVSFSVDKEAVEYLPKITDEDIKTHQERYHILLGDVQRLDVDKVNIRIKGILEADPKNEDEKDLFYSEGIGQVSLNFSLSAIKQWVKFIQEAEPEYRDFNFVGEIHTHAVEDGWLDKDVNLLHPSSGGEGGDFENIIQEYEDGNLSADKPFVFGIAGRVGKNTEYVFYRLVKKDNKYKLAVITPSRV